MLWLDKHYIEFPLLLVWFLVSLTQLGQVHMKEHSLVEYIIEDILSSPKKKQKNEEYKECSQQSVWRHFQEVYKGPESQCLESGCGYVDDPVHLLSSSIGPTANPTSVPERKVRTRLYFLNYDYQIYGALRLALKPVKHLNATTNKKSPHS